MKAARVLVYTNRFNILELVHLEMNQRSAETMLLSYHCTAGHLTPFRAVTGAPETEESLFARSELTGALGTHGRSSAIGSSLIFLPPRVTSFLT